MSERGSPAITCLFLDIGGVLLSDVRFFRLALDVAQTDVAQVLFVENTAMHLQVAATLGIRGLLHSDWRSTQSQLAELGLADDGGHDAVV
ncbi:MAG: FMN phosphatase YigB (HAD superfamily) [Planctomycetota bacterium]|jgi:FMN phosphatase YigB (HAD superfamily)